MPEGSTGATSPCAGVIGPTSPPYAVTSPCMPRQTPRTGTAAHRSSSPPTAKSAGSSGRPGPGDSTMWEARARTSAAVTSSCSTTVGSRPVTAATRCTRFQVYESWWSTTTTPRPVPSPATRREKGWMSDGSASGGGEQVEDQVVDELVAVLGEDRLGVELDPAEVRPGDQVHVAGPWVRADRDPIGKVAGRARDERVVEPDVLLAAAEVDPGLGALEHDVLVGQVDAQTVAQHLVAQAHRQERLAALEQPVEGAPERGDLRVVTVAGVAGSGPDDPQVVALQRLRGDVLVAYHRRAHPHHREHVPEHVDEVVLAVEDHRGLALELRRRR